MGTITKNSARQPQLSVIQPPVIGPTTELTPKTDPMIPWYFPRCLAGIMSPMTVCDRGISVPMPRPWMPRPRISIQNAWALPETTEPIMNTTRPAR